MRNIALIIGSIFSIYFVKISAQPKAKMTEILKFKESSISQYIAVKNGFYFTHRTYDKSDNGTNGLYFYNAKKGKASAFAGVKLKYFVKWIVFENKLIFAGNNGVNGVELWISDGTQSGTKMIKDCSTFKKEEGSEPYNFNVINDKLYFTISYEYKGKGIFNQTANEIWTTDGTEVGTKRVKELGHYKNMVKFKNKLFFNSSDNNNGQQLWVSDGTEEGTHPLCNMNPTKFKHSRPQDLCVVGEQLFFIAFKSQYDRELFVTDGTETGTHMVKDLTPGEKGSTIEKMFVYKNKLFFTFSGPGYDTELWFSDGTEEGTMITRNINTAQGDFVSASNPDDMCIHNNILYFSATDGIHGTELWSTDGSYQGTKMVKNINTKSPANNIDEGSNPAEFSSFGNMLLFQANDGINGSELWLSNGNEAGTVLLKDIFEGPAGSSPTVLEKSSKYVYFYTNIADKSSLWATDGTVAGTFLVSPKKPKNKAPNIDNESGFVFENNLYFMADFGGKHALTKLTIK